ncbi:hypothetical protein [uncultured Roseobacter sp.]|uniref:hypothetical protein n=1 Tax=uncultured Roseobacter sp. TaxID=114847 RepID=UPI002622C8D7|nr:hypothetical protein [uncultured Roseobacter sp.]
MSAISFNAPYAPQPVAPAQNDTQVAGVQAGQPPAKSASGNGANMASDHSGQGAGNGTGTGGAHLASLLKRGRVAMLPVEATPKSVIDAQADQPAENEYLVQQAKLRAESKALQEARDAARAADKAAAAAQAAAEAAKPEFKPPNPLPTAPILDRGDG